MRKFLNFILQNIEMWNSHKIAIELLEILFQFNNEKPCNSNKKKFSENIVY